MDGFLLYLKSLLNISPSQNTEKDDDFTDGGDIVSEKKLKQKKQVKNNHINQDRILEQLLLTVGPDERQIKKSCYK